MSLEAEYSLLGAILLDERTLPAARSIVSWGDFTVELHGSVFRAACILADSDKAVDPVTVQALLNQQSITVSDTFFASVMEACTSIKHAEVYAREIADTAYRRKISNAAAEALDACDRQTDPQEIAVELTAALEEAVSSRASTMLRNSFDMITAFAEYRKKMDNEELNTTVSTGYTRLDKLLGGGMVKGGLYILAARPGKGKTTLALEIASRVSNRKEPVLFISLEMSEHQMTAKRLAHSSNVPYGKLLNSGDLEQGQQENLAKAMSKLADEPLYLNNRAGLSVTDIAYLAMQIKGLQLIVVDYLGLLRHQNGKTQYEKITATSQSLKQLALKCNVPLLCLAQLNRASENEKREPKVSDLRDSGSIEQDADGILLLHEQMDRDEIKPPAPLPLLGILAKNRHGSTGRMNLNFYLPTSRIVEA